MDGARTQPIKGHSMTDLSTGLSEADRETLANMEATAREWWGERQEDCAKYGANIPMPTIPVAVDLFCRLLNLARAQGPRQDGDFADVLVMTGCKDRAELEDMANIGRSFMERLVEVIQQPGPFHGWVPMDDPTELVTDMADRLDEALSASPVPTLPEVGETARDHEHSAEKATPKSAATWLPIESAPRDETRILLFSVPNEVPSLRPHIAEGFWRIATKFMAPGFWQLGHAVGPSFSPTHWMPLPAAPADGTGKGPVSSAEGVALPAAGRRYEEQRNWSRG